LDHRHPPPPIAPTLKTTAWLAGRSRTVAFFGSRPRAATCCDTADELEVSLLCLRDTRFGQLAGLRRSIPSQSLGCL
jgi:hypothetical protein